MPGPLAGVRVIEIAQEIQGPYAGLFLADMGADVVKLEMREIGDLSRHMLIGVIAGPDAPHPEFSHYFLAMNYRMNELQGAVARAQTQIGRLLETLDCFHQ